MYSEAFHLSLYNNSCNPALLMGIMATGKYFVIFYCAVTSLNNFNYVDCNTNNNQVRPSFPGHLEKLGSSTDHSANIKTIDYFPDRETFFKDYIFKSEPVKFHGVVKQSYASKAWSDEYFLSLTVPHDNLVLVNGVKKEDRKSYNYMHFHSFVKQYNETDIYMMDNLPDFLRYLVLLMPYSTAKFVC